MKKWLAIALVLSLAACGKSLSGAYGDAMGVSTYRFQSDGSLVIDVAGVQQQARYSREGNVLQIALPDSDTTLQFSLNQDGSLSGPMGVHLIKLED